MFQSDFGIYLGKEMVDGYFGFIAENNFFLIFQAKGLTVDEGRDFLNRIKTDFVAEKIENLHNFEDFLAEKIKEKNLPADFSLAAAFLKDNILYLKTINEGKIYLYRDNLLASIIEGNLSASGYAKDKDIFVITVKNFSHLIDGEKKFKGFFDHKKPSEIIDEISPIIKGKEDEGLIALFVQFLLNNEAIQEEDAVVSFSKKNYLLFFGERFKKIKENFFLYSQRVGKRRILTFIVIALIFFILLWSVIFGAKRRHQASLNEKIQMSQQVIKDKLSQAQDEAFFNLEKSKELINEANKELQNLKTIVGERKEVEELNNLIKNEENKILKKEEKKVEEFFDLSVENKEAKGERLYLNGENLIILDKKNGEIYTLSLTKKSLDKQTFKEIKEAMLLASYDDDIFFNSSNGVYKIQAGKIKKILENDKNWGEIVDFFAYNGNLYLLDKGKSEIYKYTPTADGYSDKISYFKGGGRALNDALSIAIDSSVYIGLPTQIFKFTAGQQEEFKTNFPEKDVVIKKIYTNKDLEKLYVWDNKRGTIYILRKNGSYERQVFASILKKAYDFIVFKDNAYILFAAKIYQLNLD